MKIEWNRVTWYSKFLAMAVFAVALALLFYLGIQYRETEFQIQLTVDASQVRNKIEELNDSLAVLEGVDLSRWKKYRDEKNGFEVLYPPSWFITKKYPFIVSNYSDPNISASFPVAQASVEKGICNAQISEVVVVEPNDASKLFRKIICKEIFEFTMEWRRDHDAALLEAMAKTFRALNPLE